MCATEGTMSKHYDVVVLGGGPAALATAALLARRSWRVLVLGQNHKPARYVFDGLPLARRAFTLLAGQSPALTRILVELARRTGIRVRFDEVSGGVGLCVLKGEPLVVLDTRDSPRAQAQVLAGALARFGVYSIAAKDLRIRLA